jgi:hypothetical protein
VIAMKLVSSQKILKKYSKIKFYENQSSGSRYIPCRQLDGWTDIQPDGHEEANSHNSQFCKSDSKYVRTHNMWNIQ